MTGSEREPVAAWFRLPADLNISEIGTRVVERGQMSLRGRAATPCPDLFPLCALDRLPGCCILPAHLPLTSLLVLRLSPQNTNCRIQPSSLLLQYRRLICRIPVRDTIRS